MIGRMIGMTVLWLALMGAPLFGAAGTVPRRAPWPWRAEMAAPNKRLWPMLPRRG